MRPHSSSTSISFASTAFVAIAVVASSVFPATTVNAFSPSNVITTPIILPSTEQSPPLLITKSSQQQQQQQRQREKFSTTTSTSLSATSTALTAPLVVASALLTPPPTYALFGLAASRKGATSNNNSNNNNNSKKKYFSIPSLFHPSDSRPIVLFDGKCNLCNAGVQLILDTDRASSDPRGNLRVAALQSRVGKVLLSRLSEEERSKVLTVGGGGGNSDASSSGGSSSSSKEYKSIVVMEKDRTFLNSAACLRIGRELKGPLRYLALLASFIPAFIRDPIYKLMSRHRKRFFGESAECRLWDDNWDTRFVDDEIFGGKGSQDVDPFADPSAMQQEDSGEEEEEEEEEDCEEAPVGSPLVKEGDQVRVVSSKPILHTHVEGLGENGICSVGLVGTVKRVLKRQSFPKNMVVEFDVENCDGGGNTKFEAHFFPGQLRKE